MWLYLVVGPLACWLLGYCITLAHGVPPHTWGRRWVYVVMLLYYWPKCLWDWYIR